jgi:glycosyltransferase involved in cell wall biosynthesis
MGLDRTRWNTHGQPKTRQGPLRIGYLGQIARHKGIHLLIKAFQQVSSTTTQQPRLMIYGNVAPASAYMAQLERLARGTRDIQFCGAYANAQVRDVLSEFDVLVVPSTWYEIGPLVILEAFAAGVPVVASRLPNLEYQVRDEVDGLLFEPDDVGDLARQLRRLVDDPGLLERLARGIVPVRDGEEELRDLEAIYQSVLANPRHSTPVDSTPLDMADIDPSTRAPGASLSPPTPGQNVPESGAELVR